MNIVDRIQAWFAEGTRVLRMMPSVLSDKPDAWEWAIVEFESSDRKNFPPRDVIVFTGSSSITFWDSLVQDMAPLPVINRGFGGSKIAQVAQYADRIVIPYHPRAVVLFAGTNDIAGAKPKTAQKVFDGYLAFVKNVQVALPAVPIYYISITPAPSRSKLWHIAREANQCIEAYTKTDARLRYIDLTDAILKPDGTPNPELFRMDKLHPNKKGYAKWTGVIKPLLEKDLA